MTDAIDCLEGYLKGREDKMKAADKLEQDETIYQEGKKAGIKEVVDWVNENVWFVAKTRPQSEWQAKLKEWGI